MENVAGKPIDKVIREIFTRIKNRKETRPVALRYKSLNPKEKKDGKETEYLDDHKKARDYEKAKGEIFAPIYNQLEI